MSWISNISTIKTNVAALVTDVTTALGNLTTLLATGATGPTGAGTSLVKLKTAVCSTIVTGGVDLTTLSGGALAVEEVLFETDGTGLAGATNVQLVTNNANGVATLAAEAVSNLGANKSVKGTAASVTPLVPFVLESGKKLQLKATGSNGTGSGVLTVTILGRRIGAGAGLS